MAFKYLNNHKAIITSFNADTLRKAEKSDVVELLKDGVVIAVVRLAEGEVILHEN